MRVHPVFTGVKMRNQIAAIAVTHFKFLIRIWDDFTDERIETGIGGYLLLRRAAASFSPNSRSM